MLRKSVLSATMFIILCGAVGFARNIDEATYNKLVDYVNCKYMVVYVEANLSKDNQQLALTNKLNALNSCSLHNLNNIPGFETIKQALRSDAGNITPQKRAKEINQLKDKSILHLNDKEIVEQILSGIKTDKSSYQRCIQTIKNDLEEYIKPESSGIDPKTNNDTNIEDKSRPDTKSDNSIHVGGKKRNNENEKTENKPNGNDKSSSWWWFWLILGAVGGVTVWEKGLKETTSKFFPEKVNPVTKSYQDEIAELKNEKKKIENEAEKLKNKIKTLETQNKELLNENIKLGQQIAGYQHKPKQVFGSEANKPIEKTLTEIPVATNPSTLYADAIIDGFFNRLRETPNTDTIFELHLLNEQTATFTLYPDAMQLIVKRPEFLEGCDNQVLDNAQNVNIENEGRAQLQPDGKWMIIKKLNVIIN